MVSNIFTIVILQQIITFICTNALIPQITYVGLTIQSSPILTGSLQGGTRLYIKGLYFSENPQNNQVFVGQYPCNILEGYSTSSSIICQTTPPTTINKTNLQITVKVNGVTIHCPSNIKCSYSYLTASTPQVYGVLPRSSFPGQRIIAVGIHRNQFYGGQLNFEGTETSIMIGKSQCSFHGIQQTFTSGLIQPFKCKTDPVQLTGQYQFSQRMKTGKAFETQSIIIQTSFFTGQNYQHRVIPIITLNYHSGGIQGHKLVLPGKGLVTSIASYQCLVAGQQCSVIQAKNYQLIVQIPKYDFINNLDFGRLIQDPLDNFTQQHPYLGGQGFNYTRMSKDITSYDLQAWVIYARNGNASTIHEQKIVSDLTSPLQQNTEVSYVQYIRGYFYAPTEGTYKFGATCKDMFIMKISQIQNTSNPVYMQTIITIEQYSQNFLSAYANNYDVAVKSVNLTAGFHFMEIVTVCQTGGGFYKLSVVTPAWRVDPVANAIWQNDQFSIYPEVVQSQLLMMEVYGQSGYFILQKLILGNLVTVNITFGDSNDTVSKKFKSFWRYFLYGVTAQYLDISGNVTTDVNLLQGYRYIIQFDKYRSDTSFPTAKLDNLTSSLNIEKSVKFQTIRNHSAPLMGSFSLIIDGTYIVMENSTKISFVQDEYKISQALSAHFSGADIIVFRKANTKAFDKVNFVIQYGGLVNPPVNVTLDVSSMSGGLTNNVLWSRVLTQQYSNNGVQYFCVPYQFLRQHSDFPSLQITINKIPAICYNCSYSFDAINTIQLFNASLSLQTLSFTLLNYSTLTINVIEIDVSFMGVQCSNVIEVSTLSYTCTFQKNTDGSVALPAASNQPPVVHLQKYGYCNYTVNTLISISLTVTSITPTQAGSDGGTIATLIGTGFPLKYQSTLFIQICGNNVTKYIKISNQQIIFQIPPQIVACASNSQISVNGLSASFIFAYNSALNPVVSGVTPILASPASFNQQLTITGNNFGSSLDTKAFLYQNGIQIYQIGIISVTSTNIMGTVNGGAIGQYQIVVETANGKSSSSTNILFSFMITISDIFPYSGPLGGGYNLTIYGSGFGPSINSNKIYIATSLCPILSFNTTQIVCQVPRIDDSQTPDTGLNISIYSYKDNVNKSLCVGNCSFVYDTLSTPFIVLPSANIYKYQDNVIITAPNTTNLTTAIVTINGINVPIVSVNSTNLLFSFPDLPNGNYQVLIKLGYSYTHPSFIISTNSEITVYSTEGSNQGKILRYSGSAMSSDQSDPKWVLYTYCPTLTSLPFLSLNSSKFSFQMPPMPQTQTSCTITLKYGQVSKTFKYTYKYQRTPEIIITTLSNGTYMMQRTKLQTQIIQFITFTQMNYLGQQTKNTYYFNFIPVNGTHSILQPRDISIIYAGQYVIKIHSQTYGYSKITPKYVTKTFTSSPQISGSISSGFIGGKKLFISSVQLINTNPEYNDIRVCGLKSQISSSNGSGVWIRVPPLLTSITQQLYQLQVQQQQLIGKIISDTAINTQYCFDGDGETYYNSNDQNCYIGYDYGSNIIAHITAIRYMPALSILTPHENFINSVIQGSQDNISWTTIVDITYQQIQSDWNYWRINQNEVFQFRYVRFRGNQNNTCMISGFQIYGYFYSTASVTSSSSYTCDITIHNVPTQIITIPSAVTYSHVLKSEITSIYPLFGPTSGGTTIHLVGTNFGVTVTVTIDGVLCSINSNNLTDIYCTTGTKTQFTSKHSFIVTSNDNYAIISSPIFVYADRWSQAATWGGQQFFPLQNASVIIPKQKTVLYDLPNSKLYKLTIQGQLYFADEQDMNLSAQFIFVNGGKFQAGTQENPYQNILNINLLGKSNDFQMAEYSNKVLVCQNCNLKLHGKSRNVVWTQLSTTVNSNSTTINLVKSVDWQSGQKIVIASTQFDGNQTQTASILSVDATGTILTLNDPLQYKHFSGSQSVGTQIFQMRAQVGLLSRNIRILNGNAQEGVQLEYGPHIVIKGKQKQGLKVQLQNAQIKGCGKISTKSQVCLQFFYNQQIPKSYVKSLSIHDGNMRGITLKGVHHLLVQNNVIYNVKSHGFILQDGIQKSNIIQDNLIINTNQSYNDLFNGARVSSFWITNPYNIFRRNHAVGSQFQGILYQFNEHSTGPSASSSICPIGQRVLISENNVAHSNQQYGFRIYVLSARRDSCKPTFNESLLNPFLSNPSIQSIIQGYRIWKNNNIGLFAQKLGNTKIRSIKAADNLIANIQIDKTNLTKQLVTLQNCIILGYSANAPVLNPDKNDIAYGLVLSRTDGLIIKNTYFVNFMTKMIPIKSCSRCQNNRYFVSGGVTTQFQNITFSNIQGKYVFWARMRRQIFIDLDGTLTAPIEALVGAISVKQSKGIITPNRPSLLVPGHCFAVGGSTWNNSIYCDQTISMRSITLAYMVPAYTDDLNVVLLTDPLQNASLISSTRIDSQKFQKYPTDISSSWSYPFAVNQYYRLSWGTNLDFTHIIIAPTKLWQPTEAIILRFDYQQYRDTYQIIKIFKQTFQKPYLIETQTSLNISQCYNGQFNIDLNAQSFFICISGRNKTIRQWIDVVAIPCQNYCPQFQEYGRENFARVWSNATQWPNGILPRIGDNVTIHYQWNMILDINPPVLNFVDIKGRLIFDKTRDNIFQAQYIWVSDGKLTIGDTISTFKRKAQIILHGNKSSNLMSIGTQSGNKILAITGSIQTNGNIGSNIWTRLTEIAKVGDVGIRVQDTFGWTIGDTIVIGPSYSGTTQQEERNITDINHDFLIINFTQPLLYEHYGSVTTTLTRDGNVLDTRSAVGIISRNIKIRKADDNTTWGCHILNYLYGTNQQIEGQIIFRGVEIKNCGQQDTTYAAMKIKNFTSNSSAIKSIIIKYSSINKCLGYCLYISNSNNIQINNNIIFKGQHSLVYTESVQNYKFKNNLLMGVYKRLPEINYAYSSIMSDDTAAYTHYLPINKSDNIEISYNLVQGSQGQGFVFPLYPCEEINNYPFIKNTAGSCEIGFALNNVDGYSCLGAQLFIAYANKIGILANPMGQLTKLSYQNLLLADNQIGISLNFAHETQNNTLSLQNSYIFGISRPECSSCYSQSTISFCKQLTGVEIGTVTLNGVNFPLDVSILRMNQISSQAAYDFKTFVNNVVFSNFFYNSPLTLPYCKNMAAFRANPTALDGVGSVYLTNTKCWNCQSEAYAYFQTNNTNNSQCGNIPCTGPQNYFIYDRDGLFTGKASQLVPYGNIFKQNIITQCNFKTGMNGYDCDLTKFAILQFESIAIDYKNRSVQPVQINYTDVNFTLTVNSWKQWPINDNQHYMRFWSMLSLYNEYSLAYSSNPPYDSRFQIQKRILPNGNPQDYFIIKIKYEYSSIQILVKNDSGTDIIQKPEIIYNFTTVDLNNYSSICGANTFNPNTGIIQFVVNGNNNCQVRVRSSNFLTFTFRIDQIYATYILDDSIPNFMFNFSQFLDIPQTRIVVYSIYEGSTTLEVAINTLPIPLDKTKIQPVDSNAQNIELQLLAQKIKKGIEDKTLQVGGPIIYFKIQVIVKSASGQLLSENEPSIIQKNLRLILGLSIGIPLVVILIAVAICCGFKGHDYFQHKFKQDAEIQQSSVFTKKDTEQKSNDDVSPNPFIYQLKDDLFQSPKY